MALTPEERSTQDNAIALGLFKNHPKERIVYLTSDTFAFFDKSAAEAHASILEDKEVTAVLRNEPKTQSEKRDIVAKVLVDKLSAANQETKEPAPKVPAPKPEKKAEESAPAKAPAPKIEEKAEESASKK